MAYLRSRLIAVALLCGVVLKFWSLSITDPTVVVNAGVYVPFCTQETTQGSISTRVKGSVSVKCSPPPPPHDITDFPDMPGFP